jgi:hypothetical protein
VNVARKYLLYVWMVVPLIFILAMPLTARAAITEVRKDFLNLTSLLPASAVMAAPSVAGSYMICVTAGNVETTAPTAILRWTDENGLPRSFTYPAVNGVPNGCDFIRNAAGSAATIENRWELRGPVQSFCFWDWLLAEWNAGPSGIKRGRQLCRERGEWRL